MSDVLLQLIYLLRPLMFIYVDLQFFGLSFFEVVTAIIVGVLLLAFMASPGDQRRPLDRLDIVMLAFVAWVVIATVLQWEASDLRASIKWALPFGMFVLLRRAVRSEKDYFRYLRNLILGFAILAVVNVAYIAQGKGLYSINWYSGFERYQGVFKDLHTMAHTIGFSVMLVFIYLGLLRAWRGPAAWRASRSVVLVAVCLLPVAAYSLWKGNVRTVMIGIAVYIGALVWLKWRRYFAAYIGALVAAWLLSSTIQAVFWDVTSGKGVGSATEMAGSGRPMIWKHNLELFAGLPFDQQLSGQGVGNEIGVIGANGVITAYYRQRAWESHNDFLSALMELGVVGLALVIVIHLLLYRHIATMPPQGRAFFMALLVAVVVMNLLSNSYLNRFGLGQLFVMVMIGVDVAKRSSFASPGRLRAMQAMPWLPVRDARVGPP